MISKKTYNILKKIKANNNRDWFADNKPAITEEIGNAKAFFEKIYQQVNAFVELEKFKMFRIYKDVRFAKDKTPYKTHFSAVLMEKVLLQRGGFYIHIEPNNNFIAGGVWEPTKEELLRIRKEFEYDLTEINNIVKKRPFQSLFGDITGSELKTAPKGFDREHPHIHLIRKKQFVVMRKFDDKTVLSADFEKTVVSDFKAMLPFINYMNAILSSNLDGEIE